MLLTGDLMKAGQSYTLGEQIYPRESASETALVFSITHSGI